MFRRLSHTLPPDPEFSTDLEGLGYFLNENDQIRSIERPDQEFHYFISKSERVLEKQREAMDTCVRDLLKPRFAALGLNTVPLPKAAPAPHIPILASNHLPTASRVIIYFGESVQDLGVFAYRTVGQVSVSAGGCIDFVKAIQTSSNNPAVVIANCGQLIWHRRGSRAVTQKTWNALPQKYGVTPLTRLDEVKNRVEGHRDVGDHIASVMKYVGKNAKKGVKVDLIGVGDASEDVVGWLNRNWGLWKDKIDAVAIGMSYVWNKEKMAGWSKDFADFWSRRGRVYLLSDEELETPLEGRESFGCNCYACGETKLTELIMPKAYTSMLSFFSLAADVPGYAEMEASDILVDSGRDSQARLAAILKSREGEWRVQEV